MGDEDDMELGDTPRSRRSGRRGTRQPPAVEKYKYMSQLQEVANRERDAITIELEDLKQAR